jgi:hypothetical protein
MLLKSALDHCNSDGDRHPELREGSPRTGTMRTTGDPSTTLGMTRDDGGLRSHAMLP